MLQSLSRALPVARSTSFAQCSRVRGFSAVPINQVARVVRMDVQNEDNAVQVDSRVKDMVKAFQQQAGYVKTKRTLCKSEWAYEVEVVFNSLDNFKAYMDGPFRANEGTAFLESIEPYIKKDSLYLGARVYDEL